jgi:hypothetical protein
VGAVQLVRRTVSSAAGLRLGSRFAFMEHIRWLCFAVHAVMPTGHSGIIVGEAKLLEPDRLQRTAERRLMIKRSLRIVKHLGQVPCVAVCTYCRQQFDAPMSTLPRVKEAQASIQKQFDNHKCKRGDATERSVPME